MEKKMRPGKIDEFHAHEALDRSALIASMFEDWIQAHPYVDASRELKSLAAKAMDDLAKLHQRIGQKRMEDYK